MKKHRLSLLVVITVAFAAFTAGLFIGRNHSAAPVTVSVPAALQTLPPETVEQTQAPTEPTVAIEYPIDINLADKEAFMTLPGIGEVLAQRIIDYRTEHGSFENVEGLMNVEGIGKKRMEDMLELITVGG